MALMDTMMGGRAAEELIFGPEKITSGAASDLKVLTHFQYHAITFLFSCSAFYSSKQLQLQLTW